MKLSTAELRDVGVLKRIVKALDEVLVLTGDETLFLEVKSPGTIDAIQDNALRARYAAANAMCDFNDTSAIMMDNIPHQIRRGG